jgi:hypothetical protein
MRIETNAFGRPVVRPYTPPAKEFGYGGSKMKHTQPQVLTPQKGFIKCPRCINGVAKVRSSISTFLITNGQGR